MNISFDGSVTKEEFKSAATLLNSPLSKKTGMNINSWIILTIIGAVLFFFGVRTMFVEQNIGIGGISAVLGTVIFSYGLKVRTAIDKLWDNYHKNNPKLEGISTDEYLEVRNSQGKAQILWTAFNGYGEYNNVILLIQGNTGHFFSKELFQNEEDWNEFRKFISSRFTITHKIEKNLLSLRTILLAGWIIVSILIVFLVLSNTGAK